MAVEDRIWAILEAIDVGLGAIACFGVWHLYRKFVRHEKECAEFRGSVTSRLEDGDGRMDRIEARLK